MSNYPTNVIEAVHALYAGDAQRKAYLDSVRESASLMHIVVRTINAQEAALSEELRALSAVR